MPTPTIRIKLLAGTGIPVPEPERGPDCPTWLRPGEVVEVADRSWAQRMIARGDVAIAEIEPRDLAPGEQLAEGDVAAVAPGVTVGDRIEVPIPEGAPVPSAAAVFTPAAVTAADTKEPIK